MTNSDDIKNKAKSALHDAEDAAHGMANTLKSGARDAAARVSERASRTADNAKDSIAEEVGSVASALRNAAQDMRSGSAKERTFSQIADSLADVSESVQDKDLGELMDDVSAFARRNPLMFMGGAALLGFAASRLIKASDDGRRASQSRGSYGSSSYDNRWEGREPYDRRAYDPATGRMSQSGNRPASESHPAGSTYAGGSTQKVEP